MRLCRKCYDSAVKSGNLDAVIASAKKHMWLCPEKKEFCGKTRLFSTIKKVADSLGIPL